MLQFKPVPVDMDKDKEILEIVMHLLCLSQCSMNVWVLRTQLKYLSNEYQYYGVYK